MEHQVQTSELEFELKKYRIVLLNLIQAAELGDKMKSSVSDKSRKKELITAVKKNTQDRDRDMNLPPKIRDGYRKIKELIELFDLNKYRVVYRSAEGLLGEMYS
jgi:hypothetical protein